MEDYDKTIRFGTSAEGGLKFTFADHYTIEAGYEKSIIFRKHLFGKWVMSSVIEDATQSLLDGFIDEILDRIRESYIVIPFDRHNQQNTLKISPELQWLPNKNHFVLRLEEQQILANKNLNYVVIGLKGFEGNPKLEELISWGESCQIGSNSYINSIRDRRIYGAKRQRILEKEKNLNLIPPHDVALFQVEINPEFIAVAEVLIIVSELENIPQPVEIMLYTVPYQ